MEMKYMSPDIEIVLLNTPDIITNSFGKEEEDHGGFGGEWNDW